ncbi:MAG TPA: GNAT family N-acetyltransferase [Methanoregulaceae archaeon]|nr:GNAT family N-acetyltransferase [Methanoregulaceae archaeon]
MEENDRIAEFAIGQVTDRTFPEFLHLLEALACYEHLNPPDDTARSRLKSDLLQDHPRYEAYLGRLGDVAVGFVTFFFTYSTFLARPTLYLEDLFVLPEARGKGAGKALLLHLAKLARERGCARMEWAVLDWNKPAIDFYRSLGAAPMDEWTVFRLTEEKLRAL